MLNLFFELLKLLLFIPYIFSGMSNSLCWILCLTCTLPKFVRIHLFWLNETSSTVISKLHQTPGENKLFKGCEEMHINLRHNYIKALETKFCTTFILKFRSSKYHKLLFLIINYSEIYTKLRLTLNYKSLMISYRNELFLIHVKHERFIVISFRQTTPNKMLFLKLFLYNMSQH